MKFETAFENYFKSTKFWLLIISLLKFFLLLIFAGNYGLFRDEFYYIECSKNLSWGFVDQQPFSALMLAISRLIFGESIFGVRIFAYAAGSATVFISGLTAKELGGGKFAQILTAICVLFSGVLLGTSGYYSMNAFDIFFSAILFWLLIRLVNTDNKKLWFFIGLLFGIGLQNKLTFLFLGFGLFVGLLLTPNRKYFKSVELWMGAIIAMLIFLPNIIWQILFDFPTIEFMRNAAMYKNQPMGLIEFTMNSMLELNPGFAPFILTALYFLFFHPHGKKYSLIGWIFLSVFAVFVLNNGKPYYMGVLYPVVLAAGITGFEFISNKFGAAWLKPAAIVWIIPFTILITPFAIPVLAVDDFLKFQNVTGIKPASGERAELGSLPQFYADRFGWEELARQVSDIYKSLPDSSRQHAFVYAQNYGQAGAIDYYSTKYDLPKVISGHNNYWLWGYTDNFDGSTVIVIGSTLEDNLEFFEDVELAAQHRNPLAMPFENVDIFICRNLKVTPAELWRLTRLYI